MKDSMESNCKFVQFAWQKKEKKRKDARARGGETPAVNGIKAGAETRRRSLRDTGESPVRARHTRDHCHVGRSSSGVVATIGARRRKERVRRGGAAGGGGRAQGGQRGGI